MPNRNYVQYRVLKAVLSNIFPTDLRFIQLMPFLLSPIHLKDKGFILLSYSLHCFWFDSKSTFEPMQIDETHLYYEFKSYFYFQV